MAGSIGPLRKWIEHDAGLAVAVKHYLQVTEDHFKQASKQATQNPTLCLHQTEDITPELQRVIGAWPVLPTTVRHSLLTIIDAVGGHPDEASR